MAKRIIAVVLGLLALASSLWLALEMWFEATGPISSYHSFSEYFFVSAVLAVSIAVGFLAFRFVRFGATGRRPVLGRLGNLLLGLGCFFPGFVFSLMATLFVVERFFPRANGAEIVALGLSFATGAVCAIAGVVHFMRQQKAGAQNSLLPTVSASGPETNDPFKF